MYKFIILGLVFLLSLNINKADLHSGEEILVSVDTHYRYTAEVNKFYLFKVAKDDLNPDLLYQIKISFLGTVTLNCTYPIKLYQTPIN
jgi:hypothetical protein